MDLSQKNILPWIHYQINCALDQKPLSIAQDFYGTFANFVYVFKNCMVAFDIHVRKIKSFRSKKGCEIRNFPCVERGL